MGKKTAFRVRTAEQQAAWRKHLEAMLATYRRPDLGGWGTAERCVGAFRREYEQMPLLEFFGGLFRIDGNYHAARNQEPGYYLTPLLLARDVVAAATIWRQVRNAWVQQWLAEAREKFQLSELPPATAMPGDGIPGVPSHPGHIDSPWLAVPWEYPPLGPGGWCRETPGVFEVYEDDLEELRRTPSNLDGVGSCEPEEFEVMNLPDLAALSRIILALYDLYRVDGLLTRSWEVEKDEWEEDEEGMGTGKSQTVFYTKIGFDCRAWLKEEGGVANG